MNSLKSVAEKVKKSPQVIRKKIASFPYGNSTNHQELREESLHDVGPLNDGIPFYCKWLGTCEVFKAQGTGCTNVAVRNIVDNTRKMKNSNEDKKLQKVLVVITTKSLKIEDMVTKEVKLEVPVYRISYCTADPNFSKVFAFIAREKGSKVLQCYALLCNKESMAKAISLTVADAFSASSYQPYENFEHFKVTENGEKPQPGEQSTSQPKSLLLLSQSASNTSCENETTTFQQSDKDFSIKTTTNPFRNPDDSYDSTTNPFLRTKEERTALPNRRPLSEYSATNAPHIRITGEEFLSSASRSCFDHSDNMKALDLACNTSNAVDDVDFDAEFTRLAECRSNSNVLETPVKKSDFHEDVATLMANEQTAQDLLNSRSSEDLLF